MIKTGKKGFENLIFRYKKNILLLLFRSTRVSLEIRKCRHFAGGTATGDIIIIFIVTIIIDEMMERNRRRVVRSTFFSFFQYTAVKKFKNKKPGIILGREKKDCAFFSTKE